MFTDIPETNSNKAPCTIKYSKEQVATWADHARSYIRDVSCGMVSKQSKAALLKEALECIDLLRDALAEISTFDGKEYTIVCKEDCRTCVKDMPAQIDELEKTNGE
jgi:hypothetical protein